MDNGLDLDLDDFGLGNISGINLYEQEKPSIVDDKNVKAKVEEKDLIFDKTFICPVCERSYTTKVIKTGKNKLLSTDTDFRPIYKDVDSIKYDTAVCPVCGYGVLIKYYANLTSKQVNICKEQIGNKFEGFGGIFEDYSYDEAMRRYKLVLLSTIVKKAKASEKAYVCLKLAWLCRGKSMTVDAAEKAKLELLEQRYLLNAIEGFEMALSNEGSMICDMDSSTVIYLLADLYRRTGQKDMAMKYLSTVLASRSSAERLKNKARDLKDILLEM